MLIGQIQKDKQDLYSRILFINYHNGMESGLFNQKSNFTIND